MSNENMNIQPETEELNSDMTLPMEPNNTAPSDNYEEEPIEQDINQNVEHNNDNGVGSDSTLPMSMTNIIILLVILAIVGILVWKFMPQIKGFFDKSKGTSTNTSNSSQA